MTQAAIMAISATTASTNRAGLADNLCDRLLGGCESADIFVTRSRLVGFRLPSYGMPMGSGSGATRTAMFDSPGPTIWL